MVSQGFGKASQLAGEEGFQVPSPNRPQEKQNVGHRVGSLLSALQVTAMGQGLEDLSSVLSV